MNNATAPDGAQGPLDAQVRLRISFLDQDGGEAKPSCSDSTGFFVGRDGCVYECIEQWYACNFSMAKRDDLTWAAQPNAPHHRPSAETKPGDNDGTK